MKFSHRHLHCNHHDDTLVIITTTVFFRKSVCCQAANSDMSLGSRSDLGGDGAEHMFWTTYSYRHPSAQRAPPFVTLAHTNPHIHRACIQYIRLDRIPGVDFNAPHNHVLGRSLYHSNRGRQNYPESVPTSRKVLNMNNPGRGSPPKTRTQPKQDPS